MEGFCGLVGGCGVVGVVGNVCLGIFWMMGEVVVVVVVVGMCCVLFVVVREMGRFGVWRLRVREVELFCWELGFV